MYYYLLLLLYRINSTVLSNCTNLCYKDEKLSALEIITCVSDLIVL